MEYEERENEKEDYRTDPAFFARAVVGMMLIFIINQWVLPADSSINVGLNPVSFLTSGTLGIPGVCLLYGITFYQIL